MKKIKMKLTKSKVSLLLSLVVFASIIIVSVTAALLTHATGVRENKFTMGDQITKLVEPVYKVQGDHLNKTPFVQNTGSRACLVRLKITVDPKEILAEGIRTNPDAAQTDSLWNHGHRIWIDFADGVGGLWERKEDGYWYYKGLVQPGGETTPVFTKVTWMKTKTENGKEIWIDHQAFDINISKESVFADAVDNQGKEISASNEDGSYNAENAARIWELYNAGK